MSCLSCFGGGPTETRSTKFGEDSKTPQPSATAQPTPSTLPPSTTPPSAPLTTASSSNAKPNSGTAPATNASDSRGTQSQGERGTTEQGSEKAVADKKTWDPHSEVARVVSNLSGQNNNIVLLEPIGQGGFATVYRGRWRNLEVAVKTVLFSEESSGSTEMAKRHSANPQQRAIMEAAVCTSVTHPNVVTTYHYDITPVSTGPEVKGVTKGSTDWKLYLVQEYCDASLQDALRNKLLHNPETRVPDMDLVLSMLMDIARGLVYIHGKNIIHGDLTPGNVLLKQDTSNPIGVVGKITDFGLCTTIDPNATHISNITNGTPYYVAPEVVACGILTKNSDVYSFGVLMWELYRCMPPWVKTETGYSQNKRFRRFPADSPRIYVAMCARCLDKNPKARPGFTDILAELQAMHAAYLLGYDSLEQRKEGDDAAVAGAAPEARSQSKGVAASLAGSAQKSVDMDPEEEGDSLAPQQAARPRQHLPKDLPPRSQNFVSYFNSKAQLAGSGQPPAAEGPGTPKDTAGINVRIKGA